MKFDKNGNMILKIKQKYLKPIFDKMIDMGWNLDDNEYKDFKDVLDAHIDYLSKTLENHERKGTENELTWTCQFLCDFFYAMEDLK